MKPTILCSLVACVSLLGADVLGGCTGNSTVPTGQLTVRWSIRSTADPNQCFEDGSQTLRVDVYFLDGGLAGEFAAACASLATTIFLNPGRYSAGATLLDGNGNPRTTTVAIPPFPILDGSVLVTDIDFPASSFF